MSLAFPWNGVMKRIWTRCFGVARGIPAKDYRCSRVTIHRRFLRVAAVLGEIEHSLFHVDGKAVGVDLAVGADGLLACAVPQATLV